MADIPEANRPGDEPYQTTRREVLKKSIFVAPVILTLPAVPSFASAGSQGEEKDIAGPNGGWGQQPGSTVGSEPTGGQGGNGGPANDGPVVNDQRGQQTGSANAQGQGQKYKP